MNELLKKWVIEVMECEYKKDIDTRFKRLLNIDEFVKSRVYSFGDEDDKDEVCGWIKEDLRFIEKVLKMIDEGQANRYVLNNFEKVCVW